MIYLIMAIIAAIMAGASFVAICKPGKDENICKYDNLEG